MTLDAKLRFLRLPKVKSIHRTAIFELPPHKRTLLVQRPQSVNTYFVQLPYLIFVLPYTVTNKKLSILHSVDDHYSNVSVYTKAEPLNPVSNKVGTFNDIRYVCFGKDVDIYGPEKNTQSLFLKISDLFFETTFPYFFYPSEFNNIGFDGWETRSKTENILDTVAWGSMPYFLLNTKSDEYETWRYFP